MLKTSTLATVECTLATVEYATNQATAQATHNAWSIISPETLTLSYEAIWITINQKTGLGLGETIARIIQVPEPELALA